LKRPAAVPRADTVAVIGGGKMGSEIAAAMAAGGWDAHVYEPDAAVRAALPRRWRDILRTVRAPRGAADRLHAHEALEDLPWRDVKLVVEAVPEVLALKRRLFRRIEALAPPRAILTTNSSSLRVSDIATAVERKERLAALHWMPPVHVVPIVEIVRGAGTSPATIRRLNDWMTVLGKLPVNLAQDVPGMLVNRLQHAMLREAYDLMDRGVVQAEDIDRAVRFGFGFRFVGCGPLRQRDINGLVIHHQSAAQIYPTLHDGRRPARGLTALVKSGRVGARVGSGFYRWDPATLAAYLQDYERCLGEALDLAKALPEPAPARAGGKSRPQRGRKA
jgi:3-hydroxybutyryl-CoA dehydrogenase